MYIFGDLQLRPFSYIFTAFLLLIGYQQNFCNISWDKWTRRGLLLRALTGRPNQMPDYVKSRDCGDGKRGHRVLAYILFVDAAVGDFHRGFGEWLASKPWRINAMLG